MKTTRQLYNHLKNNLKSFQQVLNECRPTTRPAIKASEEPPFYWVVVKETETSFYFEAARYNNDVVIKLSLFECENGANRLEIDYTEYAAYCGLESKTKVYKQDRNGQFYEYRPGSKPDREPAELGNIIAWLDDLVLKNLKAYYIKTETR